jgi:O-antigen/teichoic acid export membrane protein
MLLKHSAAYLLARGVPALVNFAGLAVFTRLLDPQEYGRYAMVIAAVGFANGVLFQWVHLSLLRYLPGYNGERERFLSTVMAGFALMMLLSALPALALWRFLPDPAIRPLIGLGLLLLWASAWYDTNQQLKTAQLQPLIYGYLTMSKATLWLLLGSLFSWWGFGAEGLIWALLGGMLLSVLMFSQSAWRGVRAAKLDAALFRQLLRYGLPLTAGFALSITISSSDRLLLGWLRGSDEAGLYAVAYDLPTYTLGVIFTIINLAAFPLAIRALEQDGPEAARAQLHKNFLLLAGIAIPAAVGIAALATPIANLLFGEQFSRAAGQIMPWIAIAAGLSALKSGYFDHAFTLGQRTFGMVKVLLAAASLNLLLNKLLIPDFGYMGAAYATLAAYALGLLLSALRGRALFRLPLPTRELAHILVAVGVMWTVLQAFQPITGAAMLGLAVLAGMAAYSLCLLLMNTAGARHLLMSALAAKRRA